MGKKNAKRKRKSKRAAKAFGFKDLHYKSTATKVYAAFFGRWRRIIDAYRVVYGKRRGNTGRISVVARKLAEAGFLVSKKTGRVWPLWTASMKPFYDEFKSKQIKLTADDKNRIETMFFGNKKISASLALEEEETKGKKTFVPTLAKMRAFLDAVVMLALYYFGNREQHYSNEMNRVMLSVVKKRIESAKPEQKEKERGEIPPTVEETFKPDTEEKWIQFQAISIVLNARAELADFKKPKEILLFKLIQFLFEPHYAREIIEKVVAELPKE
jgi:hypothetical protein